MHLINRRAFMILGSACAVPAWAGGDLWPSLAADIFDGKPLEASNGLVSLEAPYRAEDAALTPLTIRTKLADADSRKVRAITLVIDRNPVPLAAVFKLGERAAVDMIATRVRVNENTDIHAVAELSDGTLHVTSKFVKAAGGCSAPSMKNQDEAMASLGKMKLRQFQGAPGGKREAQLLIRHPNSSGFQMDQLTHYYIPARYVRDIRISAGDDLLLAIEGGISLSEDPNIRFTYQPNGAQHIAARIVDSDEAAFEQTWPVETVASGS